MPAFFIISGILLKDRYINDSLKNYINKKIRSLYFPFVSFAVLYIVLHNLFYRLSYTGEYWSLFQHFKSFVETILFLPTIPLLGGMWFVQKLFFASLIVIVLLKLLNNKGFLTNKSVLLCSIILILLSSFIKRFNISIPYFGSLTLQAASYILMGYAIRKSKCINMSLIKSIAILILLLIISFFIIQKWRQREQMIY